MGVLGIGLYGSNEPTLNFETSANQSYPMALEIIFYIGFLIAFAVKSPIIPLHTWLPDTHGEAHYSTIFIQSSTETNIVGNIYRFHNSCHSRLSSLL